MDDEIKSLSRSERWRGRKLAHSGRRIEDAHDREVAERMARASADEYRSIYRGPLGFGAVVLVVLAVLLAREGEAWEWIAGSVVVAALAMWAYMRWLKSKLRKTAEATDWDIADL